MASHDCCDIEYTHEEIHPSETSLELIGRLRYKVWEEENAIDRNKFPEGIAC